VDLPAVRPSEVVAVLRKAGFVQLRQSGSHVVMKHPSTGRYTVVAMHNKDMRKPMLRRVLLEAGISDAEFLRLR
jgi:mRNA interferase HicA